MSRKQAVKAVKLTERLYCFVYTSDEAMEENRRKKLPVRVNQGSWKMGNTAQTLDPPSQFLCYQGRALQKCLARKISKV